MAYVRTVTNAEGQKPCQVVGRGSNTSDSGRRNNTALCV